MRNKKTLQSFPAEDPVDLWLDGLSKKNTRDTYEVCLRKLMELMEMDGERLAQEAERNVGRLWLKAKSVATTKIKSPTVRNGALYALRSFLKAIGHEAPDTKLDKIHAKKKIYFTWTDAENVIQVAEHPYNYIFQLLRDCAWGITEFLKFNTEPTWELVKSFYQEKPDAPYYRHDFDFRKSNPHPYYSLIKSWDLQYVLQAQIPLPIGTERNKPLQLTSYKNSKTYIETAFNKALERSGFTPTRDFPDKPGPHDFRDAWDTKAGEIVIAPEARKFVMGHTLDPLLYTKCYGNEAWMWSQLSKMFLDETTLHNSNQATETPLQG